MMIMTMLANHVWLLLLIGLNVCAQDLIAIANRCHTIELESSKHYAHPIRDLDLVCTFTGTKDTFRIHGFWDGGKQYKVRFSLPNPGIWTYRISCNDPANSGLYRSGRVIVEPFNGKNVLYRHGGLKISDNGRYLVHADDSPFFYLADTAWEVTWKSDSTSFIEYLTDRKRKGFTALQIVIFTHQNFNFREHGIKNRAGEHFFENHDFSRLNPRYFDYLDFIVRTANDSGLVPALVPMWSTMTELYPTPFPHRLSVRESYLLARYVSSRYAGAHVIWIVGGDNVYDTRLRKVFWSKFARVIKRNTGFRQLMTLHPAGWYASYDFFDNNTEWLDFHMYQSSHHAGADYTWQAGHKGFQLQPPKPVLNGEACYEDIHQNLWLPQDTTHVKSSRIQPLHVRQASYESILSGSLVGITYGANGLWQWHIQDIPGSHQPRHPFSKAWQFPGSRHMGILKKIMQRYNWYQFRPAQEFLIDFQSAENYIPVAKSENNLLVYIPAGTDWIELDINTMGDTVSCHFIDPSRGDTTRWVRAFSPYNLVPPDTNDWLAVFTKLDKRSERSKPAVLSQNYPNPFDANTSISYHLPIGDRVKITLYNVLGQETEILLDEFQEAGTHKVVWKPGGVPTGIYFCRIRAGDFEQIIRLNFRK